MLTMTEDRMAQPPSATVIMLPDQRLPCNSAGCTCTGYDVGKMLITGLRTCNLGLLSIQASRQARPAAVCHSGHVARPQVAVQQRWLHLHSQISI